MTTLRTFQNEIEDIHHREVTKQRTQALLDKEKEQQKSSKSKIKEKEKEDAPAATASRDVHAPGRSEEVEERILVRRPSFNAVQPSIENPYLMHRAYYYLQTQATMIRRATWLPQC